jgi:putative ABC transport system substrate-binding protein
MIARRALPCLFAACAVRPGGARAQERGRLRRIGLLMAGAEPDPDSQQRAIAFVEALQGLGWAEGRQVRLERRWAAGDPVLFRAHAAELVAMGPDLLLADGTPSVAALLRETRQLPVVFVRVGDPVGSGFVESFARPGGNATGFTAFDPLMGPKWIEFLREAVPGLARVGLLFHPGTAPHVEALFLRPIEASARALGLGRRHRADARGLRRPGWRRAGGDARHLPGGSSRCHHRPCRASKAADNLHQPNLRGRGRAAVLRLSGDRRLSAGGCLC